MYPLKKMNNHFVGPLLLLLVILLICPCASAQDGLHSYLMKGSIVVVQGSDIYICIGGRDGAKVGQELDVYNIGAKPMVYKGPPDFKREHVGKIRIVEILDEHFARAVLLSGKAQRGDIVEL